MLLSALGRPQATFDGKDLYPDIMMKAAALMDSLVRNHPFKWNESINLELDREQRRVILTPVGKPMAIAGVNRNSPGRWMRLSSNIVLH